MLPEKHSIREFLLRRMLGDVRVRNLIAVSVESYATGFSAVVWMGEEASSQTRQYVYELEDELKALNISCSIIIKSDRELPWGGKYPLTTTKGQFRYRFFRVERVKDEDFVYVYSMFRNAETYRFRISLTGTLSSMLRARGVFDENRILKVYLEVVKEWIDGRELLPEVVNEIMLNSTDVSKFEV